MPRILLATDIFGHTPEMQDLARRIGGAVRVVSPYGDERPRFGGEMEAYAAFTARGGVEKYAGELAGHLANPGALGPWDLAVGMSAGASALWIALAEQKNLGEPAPRRSVLYYGSRIREHRHLRPTGDIRLVFAQREASFDPAPLAAELAAAGYDARVIPGTAHGFLNPLSPGYDEVVCAAEIVRLRGLLGS